MSNPHAFFHRIEGLTLRDGNKTAGFVLSISTAAMIELCKRSATPAQQAAVMVDARERLARSQLLAKPLLSKSGIAFHGSTLVPRVFLCDPAFGGSIGADPEVFPRLQLADALDWLGDEIHYTPHNCDTAQMALALVILVETWVEHAAPLLRGADRA